MGYKKALRATAGFFLIVGGLVHGINTFGVDLVQSIAGATRSWVAPVIYGAVGLAAGYAIWDKFSKK